MGKILFAFKKLRKKHGRIHHDWKFDSNSQILSAPVAADIDGDGKKEILFSTKNGKVYSLDRAGKLRWVFDINEKLNDVELMFLDSESMNTISSAPNVADIDDDKNKEIIFGSEMGMVYCLSKDGKEIWKYKTAGSIRGGVVACDINNDGKKEVVFGSLDKHLYLLTGEGRMVWKFASHSPIQSTPLFIPEKRIIVFGTDSGIIHAVRPDGTELWKFKANAGITAEPALLKTEDSECIVIGSLDHNLYALNFEGKMVWKYKSEGAIFSKPAIADINRDGYPEIVFGSCDNRIYALNHKGEKIWSYETDFWVVASPIITDLDNDGKPEIVAGSYDHNIYVLDPEGEYLLDYVPGLSGVVHQAGSYSDIMVNDPGGYVAKKLWQLNIEGMIVGCAELDGGKVAVNLKKGHMHTIQHTTLKK